MKTSPLQIYDHAAIDIRKTYYITIAADFPRSRKAPLNLVVVFVGS
jgi:hypothetical protein